MVIGRPSCGAPPCGFQSIEAATMIRLPT